LPSYSNSFSFEMEKDTVGCRALNLNYYCRRHDLCIIKKIIVILILKKLNILF